MCVCGKVLFCVWCVAGCGLGCGIWQAGRQGRRPQAHALGWVSVRVVVVLSQGKVSQWEAALPHTDGTLEHTVVKLYSFVRAV